MFYPAASGEPAAGEYCIASDPSAPIGRVVIVACGLFLWNSDRGRDALLNRILAHELSGIRTDCIRFVCVPNRDSGDPKAKEFEIIADLQEFKRRGHRPDDAGNFHSVAIVGGSTVFRTDFNKGKLLTEPETKALFCLVGLPMSTR